MAQAGGRRWSAWPALSWRPSRGLDGLAGRRPGAGSVSGGCIEDDLIARMRDGRLAGSQPFVLTLRRHLRRSRPLPACPAANAELLVELALELALAGRSVGPHRGWPAGASRSTWPAARCASWMPARATRAGVDGCAFTTLHGPLAPADRRRRADFPLPGAHGPGAGITPSRSAIRAGILHRMGRAWRPAAARHARRRGAGDGPDPHTAIVPLTYDPKLDDMALLEALKSPAFYVGAGQCELTTRGPQGAPAEYSTCRKARVARLHGPVGCPSAAARRPKSPFPSSPR